MKIGWGRESYLDLLGGFKAVSFMVNCMIPTIESSILGMVSFGRKTWIC